MAAVNPQTFFRFAADHHALLVELYQRRDGIAEGDLLQLIRKFADAQSPSAAYMVDRLRDLGFIDAAPHADTQYEMTRPFAELMSSLLREYRLTSVEVIRGYFTAMDSMAGEMGEAITAKDGDLLVQAINETTDHVERMRQDSRRNRDGIISTAMRVKSNRERVSSKRRYEIINRLWLRYLVPLRDMIDTQKAMDASLDRMEERFKEARGCFLVDGVVSAVIVTGQARVRRLRRHVVEDFRESIREISPLYDELRRENALARGASYALERVSKQGLTRLGFAEMLGLGNWQKQGLFSDSALEAYVLSLKNYVPTRPPPIREDLADSARDHLRLDEFDAAVREALPIADALLWLSETYPDRVLGMVLKMYGRMHSGRYGQTIFCSQVTEYRVCGVTLAAHPMRLNSERLDETL